MMKKTAQQSLMDLLLRLMPDFQDGKGGPMVFMIQRPPTIDKKAVKTLMSLWKDEDNTVAYRKFKRPADISKADIDLMVSEKLIKDLGDEFEVTAKGIEVIKTSILGDERSSWEDDGKQLDYATAFANTKPKRPMKKGAKRACAEGMDDKGNWYRKLKNGTDSI